HESGEQSDGERRGEGGGKDIGVNAQAGGKAGERGVEDEGAELREEAEVEGEPGGRAEEREEAALAEEEPEQDASRKPDRPEDGELDDPLARRQGHGVRGDEEDDDRDHRGEAAEEELHVPEEGDVVVLELLLRLGADGGGRVLEERVDAWDEGARRSRAFGLHPDHRVAAGAGGKSLVDDLLVEEDRRLVVGSVDPPNREGVRPRPDVPDERPRLAEAPAVFLHQELADEEPASVALPIVRGARDDRRRVEDAEEGPWAP